MSLSLIEVPLSQYNSVADFVLHMSLSLTEVSLSGRITVTTSSIMVLNGVVAAPCVGRHLHLLDGHGPGVHLGGEHVPLCSCGTREGYLVPHGAGPRDL